MDKVAEKLEIEVSEEEVNGQIAQLAIQRGQRPERLREQMLRDGSLAQFKLQLREEKCIAKLLESAEIIDIKPEKKTRKAKKAAGKSGEQVPKKTAAKKKQAKKSETKAKEKSDE